MNKILLASAAAVIAAMSFAAPSYAGSRHSDSIFDIEVNVDFKPKRLLRKLFDEPRRKRVVYVQQESEYANGIGYDDDSDEVCTTRYKQKFNKWGEVVLKPYQVCR